MKKLLIGIVFLSVNLLFCAESEWEVQHARSNKLGGIMGRAGDVHSVYIAEKNINNPRFGPLQIWETKNREMIYLNGSLAALNAAIVEIYGTGTGEDKATPLKYALSTFTPREGDIGMGPAIREEFFKQMAQKISKEAAQKFLPVIPPYEEKWSESTWEISVSIVTQKGAIERRTFLGRVNPVSVERYTVVLLAPNGTVPKFEFVP